jgi:hypothetical protein
MTWFRRTGQTWKLVAFSLACAAAVLLHFLHFADVLADILTPFLGLAVFAWFFVSVRCPLFQGRPIWFLDTRVAVGRFDPWGLQRCPICRDTGDVRPVDPPLFSAFRRM